MFGLIIFSQSLISTNLAEEKKKFDRRKEEIWANQKLKNLKKRNYGSGREEFCGMVKEVAGSDEENQSQHLNFIHINQPRVFTHFWALYFLYRLYHRCLATLISQIY